MGGTILETPRLVKKTEEEMFQALNEDAEILQPVVKTMVRPAVPLQPM